LKKDDDWNALIWIVKWSAEQSLRVQFARQPAEQLRPLLALPPQPDDSQLADLRNIAIETLGESEDPAAWRVLTDFALEDPARLEFLLDRTSPTREQLSIDPRMWPYLERQYARARDVTPPEDDLFGPFHGFAGQLRQILYPRDSEDRGSARDAATMMNVLPETPNGWPEGRVLASLPRCILAGHRPAADYFLRWCRTVDEPLLDDHLRRIFRCLKALAAQPDIWSVPAELAASEAPEPRLLATCLQYLRGDPAARKSLVDCITRDRSCRALLALDTLTFRHDPAAIDFLLARPEEERVDDIMFTIWADGYLECVATPAHLDALKQRAARQSLHDRSDTEDVSRTIRFRELLRSCLPGDSTDASPEKAR
jgi:hypothetical protein